MKTLTTGLLWVGVLTAVCAGSSLTEIQYEAAELEPGRWEYTYKVFNSGLCDEVGPVSITEFMIWFDEGLYRDIEITTPLTLSSQWDEVVWQPEPVLADAGAYDALALSGNSGIGMGESVYGFSVAFTWLGTDRPGAQFYEIINPVTFEPIETGWTIPEPATVLLLGLGGVLIRRRSV